MKKRHLVVFAPAARTGGALRYLEMAIPGLAEMWPGRVTLVVSPVGGELIGGMGLSSEVEIVHLNSAGGRRTVVGAHIAALQLARTCDVAVAFCIGNTAYFGPRVPCVTLVENAARLSDLQQPASSTRAYFSWLRINLAIASLRSRELIAVSRYMAQQIPLASRCHTSVVYHGHRVAPSGMQDDEEACLFGSDDGPVWLIPGAVAPYKGIELAIRGLSEVPSAYLWIVGPIVDQRYARWLQQLSARLALEDRVRWVGERAHGSLLKMMAAADVLLITSRAEACPNILLEGAAIAPDRPLFGIRHRWSDEYDDLFDARVEAEDLGRTLREATKSSPSASARKLAVAEGLTWELCIRRTFAVLWRAAA